MQVQLPYRPIQMCCQQSCKLLKLISLLILGKQSILDHSLYRCHSQSSDSEQEKLMGIIAGMISSAMSFG